MTELLQRRRYVGPHQEAIVRLAGRDQVVNRGGLVECTPEEAERLDEQPDNWQAAGEPSKDDLLQRAADLDIEGRSDMTKPQLAKAIAEADASGPNPIGAVGDPEAVEEFNRLSADRGDRPFLFGNEDETEVISHSSEDVDEPAAGEPGQESAPAPVASETEGEVDAEVGNEPPDQVSTGGGDVPAGEPVDEDGEPVDAEPEGEGS